MAKETYVRKCRVIEVNPFTGRDMMCNMNLDTKGHCPYHGKQTSGRVK